MIASNNLQYWPMVAHPQNLKSLELQNNRLIELSYAAPGMEDIEFANVTKINVSHNHIETLPLKLHYPALAVFDLSFNHFAEMPQTLGRQAPNLDWLRMSGNPLQKIEFTQKTFVRKLELSELPLLSEFDASQFDYIGKWIDWKMIDLNTYQFNFLSLEIRLHRADCIALSTASEYTEFVYEIIELVLFGSEPQRSECCKSELGQLDGTRSRHRLPGKSNFVHMHRIAMALRHIFAHDVRKDRPTTLSERFSVSKFLELPEPKPIIGWFLNLRCVSPPQFRHQRLIKYYQHEGIFCDEEEVSRAYIGLFQNASTDSGSGSGIDVITIVTVAALLTIIATLTVTIIVVLIRRRRTRLANKNNRRYSNDGFL